MADNLLLITGAGGFVAGWIGHWLFQIFQKERMAVKDRKEQQVERKRMEAQVARMSLSDPNLVFDCHVAQTDVERHAFVSVEYHTKDLVRELKEDKELHHVLRVVFNGFKVDGVGIAKLPGLADHLVELHERVPYLAVFLERHNMKFYLELIMAAREQKGLNPPDSLTAPIQIFEQEILGHLTKLLAELYQNDEKALSEVLEKLSRRLEEVCDDMEREWSAVHHPSASATPVGSPAH